MLFTKLISLYFLFLSFQGFASTHEERTIANIRLRGQSTEQDDLPLFTEIGRTAKCFEIQPTSFLVDEKIPMTDLTNGSQFSSACDRAASFVECTRVRDRLSYPHRDARYLNTMMGGFLAGYFEKVPSEYRTDMFSLVRDNFKRLIEQSDMTPKEKSEEIETILAIAAQFLSSYDFREEQKEIADPEIRRL